MKSKVDIKILIITVIICLLPMIYGIVNYNNMAENVAIHFDYNNNPDNWIPKWCALVLPVPMALLQCFICITSDKKLENPQANRKIINVSKAIIPLITVVTYVLTINNAIGVKTDIRKIVCIMLGVILFIVGNYMPKTKQNIIVGLRTCKTIMDEKKWAKMNRLMGIIFMISGLVIFISGFMMPIVSVIAIGLFIAASIVITIDASLK